MVAARQHHVVPYLAANLDRLDIPGQARSELEAAAGRQHAGAAVLAADLSVALATLRDAGVRALAFKGVALAAQAYGDFSLRGAGDLDLLVAPEDLENALTACFTPPDGRRRPAIRRPVRRGPGATSCAPATSCCSAALQTDIDLHWHLVPTRGTFPDFDTLWERRERSPCRRPRDAHPVCVRRLGTFGRSRGQGPVEVDAKPARCSRACVQPRHLARR